ncbi:predicted protein [Naegleria gruberi]|uniref:Predicted protein n=1 Tax=Naegleria gruberi TaxID=5762 RepID=D2VV65_NAEGR|nr:uncharacterized protein NAEGRDRAFT_72906 [Naegleria gruberi]EFC39255.1 predicted protein [Naegleria gruberi]|eukprot:XP_002671999.1 predicted protein [Naegleria gruberi strain NEG-M]
MTHVSFAAVLETGRFNSSTKLIVCTIIVVFLESILEAIIAFLISNISHYGFGYNVRLSKFEHKGKGSASISGIMDGLAQFFGLHECSIGFSGVIFSYLTIASTDTSQTTNSLFGMISVPSKYYPWILLLVTSFLFPSSSFVGHLFGIISGYIFVLLFERTLFISHYFNAIISKIENLVPSSIKKLDSFYHGETQYNASGGIAQQSIWNENYQSDNGSYWSKLTGGRTIGH